MPSEAAMEYLLLFWRAHVHRWFTIPPEVCPPHLQLHVPPFLRERLAPSPSAGAAGAQLLRGLRQAPALTDMADLASDEATWQLLKTEIHLEHTKGRAGDPTAVLVGPLLEAVAARSAMSEAMRSSLIREVGRGFADSDAGHLTAEQAVAHEVVRPGISAAGMWADPRSSLKRPRDDGESEGSANRSWA